MLYFSVLWMPNNIVEQLTKALLGRQVLQSVFMKCVSPCLGGTILDAISTIYHGDNANYFLLQVTNKYQHTGTKIATNVIVLQFQNQHKQSNKIKKNVNLFSSS